MPLIDELFKDTNLTLDNIDLLACSQGPGSFTGIRIGIATIKAFADAKNIPVVGVTSLESLAYNITESGLIVSLIDAKNENVYFLYLVIMEQHIHKLVILNHVLSMIF